MNQQSSNNFHPSIHLQSVNSPSYDDEIEDTNNMSQTSKISLTQQKPFLKDSQILEHEEEKINFTFQETPEENQNCKEERIDLNVAKKPLWELRPSCGICLEKMFHDKINTECNHSFHRSCLLEFIEYMQINEPFHEIGCPCCRTVIDFLKLPIVNTENAEYTPDISSDNLLTLSAEQISGLNFEIYTEQISISKDLIRTPANVTRQPLLPITMEVTPLATHIPRRMLADASTHVKNRNRLSHNSLENSINSHRNSGINIFDLSSSPVNNLANRNVKLHLSFSSFKNNSGILLPVSQEFTSKQPYLPDRLSSLAQSINLEVKSLSLERSLALSNTFWAPISRTFLSDGHPTNVLMSNITDIPMKNELLHTGKSFQAEVESVDSKYSQKENIAPMLKGIKKHDQEIKCETSQEIELRVSLGSNYVIPDSDGSVSFPILFNLHASESVDVNYCSNDIVIVLGFTKNPKYGGKLIENFISVMNKADRLAILALNAGFNEKGDKNANLIMDFTKNTSAGVVTVAKNLVALFNFGDKLDIKSSITEILRLLTARKYCNDVVQVFAFVEEVEEELGKLQILWELLDSQKDRVWLVVNEASNPTIVQKLWNNSLKTLWMYSSFEELTIIGSDFFRVAQNELRVPFHSGKIHFLNQTPSFFELTDTEDRCVENTSCIISSSIINTTSKVLLGKMAKNGYSTYCQKIFESKSFCLENCFNSFNIGYFTASCSRTQDPTEKLKLLKLKGPSYLQAQKSYQTLKVEVFHPQVSNNPPKLRRDPKVYTTYAKQLCLRLLELLLLEQDHRKTQESFGATLKVLSEIPTSKMSTLEFETQTSLKELLSLIKGKSTLSKVSIINRLTLLRNNLLKPISL